MAKKDETPKQNPGPEQSGAGTANKNAAPQYRVLIPFQDAPEHLERGQAAQRYAEGDTLPEGFCENRLRGMLQRGIVEAL